ncbi:phospholipase D-like domain-containing protein [Arenibaculum sp.]|uniref:phospholipase D-like domain-containing protein n=1 Tax=Arenibaculum sp. TaxID=2865862 RepID=UPI002E0E8AEE|nr:phospholipase D-like domain-containing protein [Arenibaculum sp.]
MPALRKRAVEDHHPAGSHGMPDRGMPDRILVPGKTCWRIVRADRFSVIVDADDYFRTAKKAIAEAENIVMAIGWDFDLRIKLEPDGPRDAGPDRLGHLVQHLVETKRHVHAYVLKWDMAMLTTLTSQVIPLLATHWLTMRRIHFRLDSSHPLTGCHHQKILVIDDSVAFCGGIDMTTDRWDTSNHREEDPYRTRPDGSSYGPFHDVTTACDGEAAQALGELARERWRRAGGKRPRPPRLRERCWPEGLPVTLEDVDVAIARTAPPYDGRQGIFEIEALYLAAIAAARRVIYMESQYFASQAVRDALLRRLAEPDGPEVVVINPESADGWLEEWTMDAARAHIVRALRDADRYGRFRIYYPVNEAGTPIYVHAKVVTVDDRLLRIGSSNLNNRSMGLDTECDVAVEAVPGAGNERAVAQAVIGVRHRLLAEHLAVPPERLAREIEERGSVIAAVDALRQDTGRTLRPLEARELSQAETAVIESRLMDPERPARFEKALTHMAKYVANATPPTTVAFLAGLALGVLAGRLVRRQKGSEQEGPSPRLGWYETQSIRAANGSPRHSKRPVQSSTPRPFQRSM